MSLFLFHGHNRNFDPQLQEQTPTPRVCAVGLALQALFAQQLLCAAIQIR